MTKYMILFTGLEKSIFGHSRMAAEDDILKTLQNIEKVLKSATVLSGTKPTFSSKARDLKNAKDEKDSVKTFKAMVSSAGDVNETLVGLNKNLIGLTAEVGKTTMGFGALNAQMARFVGSLQPVQQTPNTQNSGMFSMFTRNAQTNATRPILNSFNNAAMPMQNVLARMVQNFGSVSAATGGFGFAIDKLWDATVKITTDFFQLSRLGMGSMQNLKDLSIDAVLAGMSLKEYNELIKNSITAASKAGTLENFNKIISAQDATLAAMGIFGAEAKQLQANLVQSSASLGIGMDELTTATAAQVNIFDDLRKVSNVSADEFSKMVSAVASSTEAQKELLGLVPRERVARMNQLVQLQTIGLRMGMTAEASKQLGDALIKQRQATVKERFDMGGALLQAGAFTGNGGLGQRLFELNLKGRRRTADEDQEFFSGVQQIERSVQGLYEGGSLGTQSVLDQLSEMFDKGSLGDIVKQSRGASLAQDTGPQQQAAFGKHVGEFGQWVGKLTAWGRGLQESIAGPIAAAIGGAAAVVFRGPLSNLLVRALGLGSTSATAVAGPITAVRTGMSGLVSSMTGWAKSVTTTFQSARTAFPGIQGWIIGSLQGAGQIGSGLMSAAKSILGGLGRFVSSFGVFSGLINAGFELFTGEISDALNPSGGFFNRIGGIITAFFSAIPQMFIDVFGYVFGDNIKQQLQNGFDVFVAAVNGAVKSFFALALDGLGSLLGKILPDDSALVKNLKSWSQGFTNSADENFAAMDKLWSDQSKTLTSISKENQKSAEVQNKTTEQATAKVNIAQQKFNNVMSAGALTTAGIIQDATTLVASPQVQVPKTVAPATVNTEQQQTVVQTVPATQQITDNSDMLNVLQAMLQVMRDNLMASTRQADNSDAMLRLSKPTTSFQSSEQIADKLLNRGYA